MHRTALATTGPRTAPPSATTRPCSTPRNLQAMQHTALPTTEPYSPTLPLRHHRAVQHTPSPLTGP
ncbi:hypothetical protein [Streptomyces sp. CC228A]|uniref:hypothetical protein n=1 Tax=Streptomyces sp. CC228A TaxID=2898186 RepID=UPI001F3B75B8|nr:hypothetical protein [Streptomyces sp. CC228A]